MFATPDWKQRFRTPWVASSAIAHHAPGRGVVLSNRPGLIQAHAWDLSDHSLRQLTELDAGHGGIDHDQRIAFHELMLDFVDAALTAVAAD